VYKLAQRTNIRTFGKTLWESVQSRINPTPRGLRVEVNPELKRRYSKENRTLIFRLYLNSMTDSGMTQFYYGGSSMGAYGASRGTGVSSGYTNLLEQKQAARRELEYQKQMVTDAQQHIEKMEASTEVTEKTANTGAGYERQLRDQKQDQTDLAELQQQTESKQQEVQKLEEVEKVLTHKPTDIEAGEIEPPQEARMERQQDTEIKPKTERPQAQRERAISPDQSTFDQAAAQPVDQQTQQFIEEEVIDVQQQKLRTFRQLLKNDILSRYQARVVRQPELLANAPGEGEGEQIVMQVDPNSFDDTRRINANWRGISFGGDMVSADYRRYY
jgi:hypothetical protein